MIYRKVRDVAGSGAIPIILGGDHSITWPAATAIAELRAPQRVGIVHFDAHADTANESFGVLASHGTPMRRLIESGAIDGRNFVQVGLRGYWPPQETFDWMQEHGLRWHFMREIEERGAEAVIADAIAEALDGPDVDLPVAGHRRHRPGHGARDRNARARWHAHPRGPAGRPPDRRVRRARRDGHRRGLAALRPGGDDRDGRESGRARGHQRARGQAPGRRPDPLGGLTIDRDPLGPRDRASADDLARLYDLDLVDDPGDLDLYLALAERTGGPILELAAGTGRLAVPLAAGGNQVTAVDIDPAMLARASARAALAGPAATEHLTLVEADLVGLRLPEAGRFGLAFIALNSILVLPDRTSQRAAIQALADHLAPGGVAVVDIWLPDAEDLARFDGRIILEWPRPDPETGELVTKSGSAQHDAATGTIAVTTMFEASRQGGPTRRWVRSDRMRLLSADELGAWAEDAGLAVETIAGGYDLGALGPGSERAILLARKP